MPPILRLLRPKHWTKNLLVLAPWIFTSGWKDSATLLPLFLAFSALSLMSSATYALNDLRDIERDRLHPTKSKRPIASGEVAPSAAKVAIALCLVLGVVAAGLVGPAIWPTVAGFALLQLAYNLYAKHQPILDISVISLGYVMRPVVGAAAIDVAVSGWLVFCTGTIALLLVSAKRRQEFMALGPETATRPTLSGYNQTTLDALVIVSATTSILSYGVYAIESPTAQAHPMLILTVPFVAYGVLRYLYLVFGQARGEDPQDLIFADPHMALTMALFVAAAVFAMVTN